MCRLKHRKSRLQLQTEVQTSSAATWTWEPRELGLGSQGTLALTGLGSLLPLGSTKEACDS